jgi:hypothetical protein
MAAGPELSSEVLLGIAATQIAAIGKRLAVFHHHQVDVDVCDHLGHRAAITISGVGLDR